MLNIDELDLGDWPIDESYLVEIGRIAVLWSKLENFVKNSAANFAGLDNLENTKMYVVFSSNSFCENVELIEKLCALQLPATPNIKNYAQVINALYQAEVLKNRYLKGLLRPNQVDNSVELIFDDEQCPGEVSIVSCDKSSLNEAALEIDKAQFDLYKLVCALERPSRKV